MTEVSAIAPNKGSSGVESGSVPMHSDPNAVEWSLIDRKQLQLIIQAYDLLVSCWATGEGGLSPEVTSCADFVGGPLFLFGPFRLLPSQRLLLEGNRSIQIGVRAFDILTILVERAGELGGKDELFARVFLGRSPRRQALRRYDTGTWLQLCRAGDFCGDGPDPRQAWPKLRGVHRNGDEVDRDFARTSATN